MNFFTFSISPSRRLFAHKNESLVNFTDFVLLSGLSTVHICVYVRCFDESALILANKCLLICIEMFLQSALSCTSFVCRFEKSKISSLE